MNINSSTLKKTRIKFSLFFVLFVMALFSVITITSVRQLQQAASITDSAPARSRRQAHMEKPVVAAASQFAGRFISALVV